MRELLVIGYDDAFRAEEVLLELDKMQKAHLIDLGDAAVVVKDRQGKMKFKHFHELTLRGEQTASLWGTLLGFLLLHPGLGGLLGASMGERLNSLEDYGIDNAFIQRLGQALGEGSSALFVLVRHAHPDKVLEELTPFGGRVLRTSLSAVDEAKLRKALDARR